MGRKWKPAVTWIHRYLIGENKHVPHFINLTSLKLLTDHFKCNMFVVDQIVCQGDLMLK